MSRDGELTDEPWAALAPHLPPQRAATGRPAKDHRTALNGLLWVLPTGAPWRDPPERDGARQTAHSRFRRWRDAGVRDRALSALHAEAAHEGELDDTPAMIDGTGVRARHKAAGAKRGAPTPTPAAAGVAGAASRTR